MTRIDSIAQFFRDRAGVEVTTLEITQATGTLAPSTKVSQLRDRGMVIERTRDDYVGHQRIVGYTYFSDRLPRTCGEATGHDAGSLTPSPHEPTIANAGELFKFAPEQPH